MWWCLPCYCVGTKGIVVSDCILIHCNWAQTSLWIKVGTTFLPLRKKFYSYSVKICALELNKFLAIICTLLVVELFSQQKEMLKEGRSAGERPGKHGGWAAFQGPAHSMLGAPGVGCGQYGGEWDVSVVQCGSSTAVLSASHGFAAHASQTDGFMGTWKLQGVKPAAGQQTATMSSWCKSVCAKCSGLVV